MRRIKITAWIATGIFTLLFFIYIALLSNIQTRYGSPATSPPYILGSLIACALIPGILWIVVILTKNKAASQSKSKGSKKNNSNNSEIRGLTEQIRSFESKQKIIKDTFSTLKNSLEQSLITKQKFDAEAARLKSEFDIIKGNKKKLKNSILAIENLQPEFTNLQELKVKGIITSEEYVRKKDELIRNYTNNN